MLKKGPYIREILLSIECLFCRNRSQEEEIFIQAGVPGLCELHGRQLCH